MFPRAPVEKLLFVASEDLSFSSFISESDPSSASMPLLGLMAVDHLPLLTLFSFFTLRLFLCDFNDLFPSISFPFL